MEGERLNENPPTRRRNTVRILDIFNLLLRQRYVTLPELVDEFGIDEATARRHLKYIAQRYELVIEKDAIPGLSRSGIGFTAYYFRRAYKLGLLGEGTAITTSFDHCIEPPPAGPDSNS